MLKIYIYEAVKAALARSFVELREAKSCMCAPFGAFALTRGRASNASRALSTLHPE